MACSIAMGIPWQGRTPSGPACSTSPERVGLARPSVKAWEAEHNLDVGEDLFMITEAVLIGVQDGNSGHGWPNRSRPRTSGWSYSTRWPVCLGLEENSANDMGNAGPRFDRLRRDGKTGVMVVHHTARGATHGRGSTAILGALDSEVLGPAARG